MGGPLQHKPTAADAHDAGWVGPANTSQMQLMLMMLAGWVSANTSQMQLMLMMLAGGPRQHKPNAADHDAGWVGPPTQAKCS